MYEQLANQLSRENQITFTKVNVDQQQDIAKAYGVTAYGFFPSLGSIVECLTSICLVCPHSSCSNAAVL
jgi:hypothetical protein